MTRPKLLYVGLAAFFTIGLAASMAGAGVVAPRLSEEMALRAPGETLPVLIVLDQAPNYASLDAEAVSLSRNDRRAVVTSRLHDVSRALAEGVLGELRRLEAEGEATAIRELWIAGTVKAEVTPEAARLLASRSDVAVVEYDGKVYMLAGMPGQAEANPDATQAGSPQVVPTSSANPGDPSRAIAWGVTWIGAPTVWGQGYNGTGVLVAVLDTGIWYPHTDLTNRMWRNLGDPWPADGIDNDGNGYIDDYYGYDFANNDRDPIDDHGHGTHCSGTVAGDGTAGTQTGVAPGAKLMACKVLDSGGYGQPSDVVEAIQYVIDNGGDGMSLSIGWYQPTTSIRQAYRNACEGARVAGVVMCVAAGNERQYGSPPNLIRTPGDVPPPWIHPDQTGSGGLGGVISIGATGCHSDALAYFSSPGPVHWQSVSPWYDWDYPPGLIKPDVSAPGQCINSTVLGGGYSGESWDGTSMATPHVSGTVALILSKNPNLLPGQVDQILETTALPLGAAGKDNDFGAGRIRCPEAIAATPSPGPDTTPPGAITDLVASTPAAFGKVRLRWTAPGDDGTTGTAAQYDVRYQPAASGPLDTEAEWAAATQAVGEPAPQPAGTAETMLVGRLQLGHQYWFAMKTADEVPNWAALSNSVLGKAGGSAQHGGEPITPDLSRRLLDESPAHVELAQNSPNPIVGPGSTVISFSLAEPGKVSLRVFDVTGSLVRVLTDGQLAGGSHQVAWDGRDDRGSLVPNGVYFYRLQTTRETLTQKMAVVR